MLDRTLAAKRGRRIFERIAPELFKAICIRWQYCEKNENSPIADTILLVATVADAIAGYCGAFPPLTIAAILVKMGLTQFCKCTEARLLKEQERILTDS